MKSLRNIILMLCIMALLMPAFCQDKAPKAAPTGEPVYLAFAAPLTGQASVFGLQLKYGVEMAKDEINAAGGIKGRPLEIIYQDDTANPQEANLVANKIVSNPKVLGVIGHYNSSCSLSAKPIYMEAKLTAISPGSTNTEVCKGSPYYYRDIFTDKFQGESIATYVKNVLNLNKAAILFDNDDYGKGLKDNFIEKAKTLNLNVIPPIAFDRESTDFRPLLTNIMEQQPDIIFISGLYNQGALIAKQAREMGITTPFIAGEGVFSPGFIELAGQACEGSYVMTPFIFDLTNPEHKAFYEKATKKFGNPPDCWTVLSYDAAKLFAKAFEVKGISKDAPKAYFDTINSPETAYKGFSGTIFFDQNGDCKKPIAVSVVKGGKFALAPKQLKAE